MNNFDLLTTNKFVEKGVYNLSTDQKKEDYLRKRMEFRMFMEKKKVNLQWVLLVNLMMIWI